MINIVTLKYDPVWSALDWAKKNCPSYITNRVHLTDDQTYNRDLIDYFFADERDSFWFALRWI